MRSNQLSLAAIILALTAVFVSIGFYTADRQPPTTLGTALPEGSAIFETALQDRITSSDTSMTLVSTSTASGEALPNGDYCFTIDEGRTDTEFVCGTLGGNKQVTGLTRGLSSVTGTTTVTANKYAHRKGASVKITDYPLIQRMRNQLSGTDTIAALLKYAGGVDCSGSSSTSSICTKDYIDNTVNQGAATGTESIAGIVRLSTALQAASSTDLGGNIPLVLQAKHATDTPQRGCAAGYEAVAGAGCNMLALLSGKLKQTWLNLSEHFSFSSIFATNASSTNATTTKLAITGNALGWNGLTFTIPAAHGASSTVLMTDGAGGLSFGFATTSYAAGVMTSVSTTTAGSWDTVITTGFAPSFIIVDFFIQGHDETTSNNKYYGMKGRAVFSGTTLIKVMPYWKTDTSGSATNSLSADAGTPAATAQYNSSTVGDTSIGTYGTAQGGDGDISTTLSISAVSSTGFTIRCTTATGAGTNSNNGRCAASYEAIR